MSIRRLLCCIIRYRLLLPYRRRLALLRRRHVSTRVHGLGGRGRRSYRSPLSTHLLLDHAFQGLPQRRGVGGVWLVFQRRQDTAGDGGNVGVAAPASDGEAVRHLDQVSVRVRERVLAGGFASPSLLFPQQVDLGGIDGRSIGVLL